MESERIDRYLWAVRLYHSRSEATAACRAGHIKIGGASVKPAHLVHVGDEVTVTRHQLLRTIEVTQLLPTRAGASIASTCYIDHTPATPSVREEAAPFQRDASTGRPTKKDRRVLDRLRNGR